MKIRYLILCLMILMLTIDSGIAQWVKAYAGKPTHIDVINVDSMKVIKTIQGGAAYRMVLTPDGSKLYTTDHNYEVQVIDALADTLLKSFDPSDSTGLYTSELEGIAISPDGSRVYVSDESSDNIFVIDTQADQVIDWANIPELYEAEDMVISPDGLWLYINDNDKVLKISTDSLKTVHSTYVYNDGHGVALNQDGSKVYAQGKSDTVWGTVILSADSLTIDTTLDASAYHMELSHDGNKVFGVDESQWFSVIDAQGDSILFDSAYAGFYGMRGLSETPDNQYLLIAASSGLLKIDAQNYSIVDTISSSYRTVVSKLVQPSTIDDKVRALPVQPELYNNFPNPFNPFTNIKFNLPNAGDVKLDIYDIIGQHIKSLVNQYLPAGVKTIRFESGDLASGVYFYRLSTSDFSVQKKMLLLK